MQLPPERRTRLFTALAAAVAAGGMLLVVGHHPSDLATGVPRPPMPEVFHPPDEIAALLDDSWRVAVSEARPRPATTPDGAEVTVHDTVLVAIRQGLDGCFGPENPSALLRRRRDRRPRPD